MCIFSLLTLLPHPQQLMVVPEDGTIQHDQGIFATRALVKHVARSPFCPVDLVFLLHHVVRQGTSRHWKCVDQIKIQDVDWNLRNAVCGHCKILPLGFQISTVIRKVNSSK